ncbi:MULTISPECIES: hypothetical protein [unclassified Streptomyces]|uniref:hypothetical protein n=1 Tax=unclassified Streptomyces TaxID=2593676 RepID=UPI003331DD51
MTVLYRTLPFVAMFATLAVADRYLAGPLWAELLLTAVAAGATAYAAGRLTSGRRGTPA